MKHFYRIFDKVSERYNIVLEQPDDATRIRTLSMEMKNPNSFLANFPDDYDLYRIASYNEEDRTFEQIQPPRLLAHASRFVRRDTDGKVSES